MPEDYTILAARNAGEKPNTHPKAKAGSYLVKWYLKLADSEAGDDDVYCQKQPGNDLSEGMQITGRLEKGEFGWRLFPESQQGGGGGGNFSRHVQREGMTKDDYWGNKNERDVESQARMGRAHAQDMALRWYGLPDVIRPPLPFDDELMDSVIEHVIDWFHQDVQRFPIDADVGGGPISGAGHAHGPTSTADVSADRSNSATITTENAPLPVPSVEASPQLKGKATQLMNKAGLAKGARQAVILFRCGTLKAPPKDRLLSLVRDLEDGATHDTLIAEVHDAARAGNNPLATKAASMIPPSAPLAPEPVEVEPSNGEEIPF